MALVIEDGTGVSGANTWVTLVEADAYHEARNNTSWAEAEDEPKEAALIYAATWINAMPVRWHGSKSNTDGSTLVWPRNYAYGKEGVLFPNIPLQLKDAQCELALTHLSQALNATLSRGGDLSSVWVGPITVSWQAYARGDSAYPMVRKLLSPLYRGGGSMHRRVDRG